MAPSDGGDHACCRSPSSAQHAAPPTCHVSRHTQAPSLSLTSFVFIPRSRATPTGRNYERVRGPHNSQAGTAAAEAAGHMASAAAAPGAPSIGAGDRPTEPHLSEDNQADDSGPRHHDADAGPAHAPAPTSYSLPAVGGRTPDGVALYLDSDRALSPGFAVPACIDSSQRVFLDRVSQPWTMWKLDADHLQPGYAAFLDMVRAL